MLTDDKDFGWIQGVQYFITRFAQVARDMSILSYKIWSILQRQI